MIRAKLEIDTESIKVNGEIHCAYCGKKIEPDTEIDHGDRYEYHHCDCPDAKMEIYIKQEKKRITEEYKKSIMNLEEMMPKVKYQVERKDVLTLK